MTPDSERPRDAQQLGRYEILSELGQGAMGVVYKARDPVLDRVVAIKTINLTLPKDELAEYEARFYQEARAAGGLNHPNIVTIYDVGKSERVAYMAMEFLEGEELRSILSAREPLPVERRWTSPRRWPTGSTTRTSATSSTATSSRPTSWWCTTGW